MDDPNAHDLRTVWASRPDDPRWHAIVEWNADGGDLVARCRDRWRSETTVALDVAPPHDARCPACDVATYAKDLARAS